MQSNLLIWNVLAVHRPDFDVTSASCSLFQDFRLQTKTCQSMEDTLLYLTIVSVCDGKMEDRHNPLVWCIVSTFKRFRFSIVNFKDIPRPGEYSLYCVTDFDFFPGSVTNGTTREAPSEMEETGCGRPEAKPLFSTGDTIFTSRPWIYTALPRLFDRICYCCLETLPGAAEAGNVVSSRITCTRCLIPLYCSERCKDIDWASNETTGRHQRECAALASIGSRQDAMKLPTDFFLMIHAINRLQHDESGDVGACIPPMDRTFDVLLSHSVDMKNNSDRMSVFNEVKAKVVRCLGEDLRLDEGMLLRIYGSLQINCFGIRDPFFMERGEGLYLGPSIIDHSCERNATFLFDGLNIISKAISDIEAFEDVRISYTELFVPTCVRKHRFTKNYYFDCCCRLCANSSFADLFPLRCDNVHCSAAIPSDERALLPCLMCGQNPACTAEQLDKSCLSMRRHLEGVEENDDRITIAEFDLTEILEDFDIIRARCEKILHRDNMLIGMVQDRRGRLLTTTGRYDEAFAAFQQSLGSMRKFFALKDIKIALQLLKTGLSAFLSDAYSDASLLIAEAIEILGVCEGSDRPLVVLGKKLLSRSRNPSAVVSEIIPNSDALDLYLLAKSLLSLLCYVRLEEKYLDVESLILPFLEHQNLK